MSAVAMPAGLKNVMVDHVFGQPCITEGWPGIDFDVLTVREVFLIKPPETSFEGAIAIKRPIFSRWIFPPEIGVLMSHDPVDLSLFKIVRRVRFSDTKDIKSITMDDLKIHVEDRDVFYSLEHIVIVENPLIALKNTEIDSFISQGYEIDRY